MNTRRSRLWAVWILLAMIISACGTPAIEPIAEQPTQPAVTPEPTTTTQPTATITPTIAPTSEPTATPETTDAWYLWPSSPDGRTVNAAESLADESGFELSLDDPTNPQNYVVITGGNTAVSPPAGMGEPITVRDQSGIAFTTGAGWTIYWTENGRRYLVGGAALSADAAIAIAETLEPLDLDSWRERLAAAADAGTPPVECPPLPAGRTFNVSFEPFCVAWQDTFDDEEGYRIDVVYSEQEQFSYAVPAGSEQFAVPFEAQPRHDESREMCFRRSSFSVTLFVLRADAAELVNGMAMDSECGMQPPPESSAARIIYTHVEIDEVYGVEPPHGALWTVPISGGESRQLASFPEGCASSGLAASPDRSQIAYAWRECATPELRLINSDGSTERALLADDVQIGKGAFSPDGSRLAVVRSREAGDAPVPETSIWVIDLDSGDSQQVTEWGFFYEPPAWVDERTLIYAQAAIGTPPSDWTTYLIDSQEGGTPQPVAAGRLMAVSPDRAAIVIEFETEAADDWDTQMGMLSRGEIAMIEPPLSFPRVAWAPDSSAILVAHWFMGLRTIDRATLESTVLREATQGADADTSEIFWIDDTTAIQVVGGLGGSSIERVSLEDDSTQPIVNTSAGPVSAVVITPATP